jgi:catechol 2,3-dioxygenase-like lactoylglutathione lyase family enzyme/mannose-6-phosphate isomerase-like protein (cupin superfamily)
VPTLRRVDPRITFVTLAVADLDATRRFYLDGLGWEPDLDVPGEVIMIRAGHYLELSLWDRRAFEAEVGVEAATGVPPLTLAHNVETTDDVDRVLDEARRAGAASVTSGERREWGGYTGYFADPDGFRWEVAYNPGPIGRAVLPPASAVRNPPAVVNLDEVQAGLRFVPDRTPESADAELEGVFATVSGYRDGGVFTGEWAGRSEWERHPVGDEIVMVLDGRTTLYTLDADGEHAHEMGRHDLVVVPRNTWHRFETPERVRVLSATPQPGDHQIERPTV